MEKKVSVSNSLELNDSILKDSILKDIKDNIQSLDNEELNLDDEVFNDTYASKEKVEHRANLSYIQRRINNMNIESMSQVYKIIADHNEKFTETKTDILINLGNLGHNCINDIMNFIEYLDTNQEILLKDEIEKNDFKNELHN
jgi:hypothetical protein